MKKLTLQIISDVACPWCYIGYKRLQKALLQTPDIQVDIEFKSYLLDPTIPPQGYETKAFFTKKFGGEEQANEIFDHVQRVGEDEGIQFNFLAMPRVINTLPLHQILVSAENETIRTAIKTKLFKANFEDLIDLSDHKNLAVLLAEFGYTEAKVLEIIMSQKIQKETLDQIKFYQGHGISSVPFFIFEGKYAFSGAQPVDTFVQAIKHVARL